MSAIGEWGMTANGYSVSFWNDENIVELKSDNGVQPLNCTL